MRRFSYVLAVVGIACTGAFVYNWWVSPIRLIRANSTNVHDFYDGSGGGITGDFNRCIKADSTEEFVQKLAQKLGLNTRMKTLPPEVPGWSIISEKWWNPPEDYYNVYYNFDYGGSRQLLAYRNGELFYDISVW